MRQQEFKQLLECPDLGNARLKPGTKFLSGIQMIAQKDSKEVGMEISYYLCTDADTYGKNISYKPMYDKLEE